MWTCNKRWRIHNTQFQCKCFFGGGGGLWCVCLRLHLRVTHLTTSKPWRGWISTNSSVLFRERRDFLSNSRELEEERRGRVSLLWAERERERERERRGGRRGRYLAVDNPPSTSAPRTEPEAAEPEGASSHLQLLNQVWNVLNDFHCFIWSWRDWQLLVPLQSLWSPVSGVCVMSGAASCS